MNQCILRWSAVVCVAICLPLSAPADWTYWRGPAQAGTSPEVGLVESWSDSGENLLWKANFVGRSTPVVVGGQACAIGRSGEGIDRQEVVACFDAATGAKRWEHRYNVYNTTVPFNRVGWASLAADPETGFVYSNGVAGRLNCYDRDGSIVWSRFLSEELGLLSGYGGRTQTPMVDGDRLILSFVSSGWNETAAPRHRYHAFDKRTGRLLWVSTPGRMPYDMNTQSGPVVAEIGGRRLLIGGNADGWVYALEAATGNKVWEFQLSRRGLNSNVLVVGKRVYASHSEENHDSATMGRLVCIDGSGSGDVTATHELWRIDQLAAGFPSPAYQDGRLYVVDNSANLHALDAWTGEEKWSYSLGTVGKASPVLADGKLYVAEVNGRFHILEPTATEARPLDLDELTVPDGRYAEIYGSPAVSDGRIYFTTEGGFYCLGADGASPDSEGPASIRVIPAEALLAPGETLAPEVWAFDERGRPLGARVADWVLDGLAGTVDGSGRFRADPGTPFQAGRLKAVSGGLESAASIRVVSELPWFIDFEAMEPGSVPGHWIGARGKFEVADKDGGRVLVKRFRERGLLRNALYMGPTSWSDYTIEADVMGGQKGRRKTDAGLIANGYTLDLMGNGQRVEVRSWPSEERMAQRVDFPWETGIWYRMKLRVEIDGRRAVIRGKVWPRSEPEPDVWTITVEDPHGIPSGSPGLIGYSPADVFYDNIKVMVNR